MLGAILGDIIGSPYEFDEFNIKTKDFPLFSDRSEATDDSIMTLAVAEAMLDGYGNPGKTWDALIHYMQRFGRLYPHAGYGVRFIRWLREEDPQAYYSFGNGSAMRVSSVAWIYDTLEDVLNYARISAEVSHDHPEGIKGAQATAAAIFLARSGASKQDIRDYIETTFSYDLSRTCDEIRPNYRHVESCQETVPEAITAFLEGESFEDVIRTAVSLGGDSDTLTAIAGSIAEAFYGVPDDLRQEALDRLDEMLLGAYHRFAHFLAEKTKQP